MRVFYNLFVFHYQFFIKMAALFGNEKAKKWVDGRKRVFHDLKDSIKKEDKVIWVHCASLGEFEQGRPLIEKLKDHYKDYRLLLTFFSPSGYEIRKAYDFADYIMYLPMDTQKNARKFVRLAHPRIAFFIKYDFWFNYINELSIRKIPLFMVSTIFRPSQHFFKFWGGWFKKQLRKITYLFVQDEASIELLENIKIYHAEIIGDTRFDRVIAVAEENKDFPLIEKFKENLPLMLAGSTWPADENKLLDLLNTSDKKLKLIIAPHQVDKEHIKNLVKLFEEHEPVLYSAANSTVLKSSRLLIIDSIGILSYIYKHADLAYIGGGFGAGIHNILEAASFGLPIIFGPNYNKFKEAVDLIELGGAYHIANSIELIDNCESLFSDIEKQKVSGEIAKNYVYKNAGATEKVLDKANEYLQF